MAASCALSRPALRPTAIGGRASPALRAGPGGPPLPRGVAARRVTGARLRAAVGLASRPGSAGRASRAATCATGRGTPVAPVAEAGGKKAEEPPAFLHRARKAGIPLPGFSRALYVSVVVPPVAGFSCAYLMAHPEIAQAAGFDATNMAMSIKYGMGAIALIVLLFNTGRYMNSDAKTKSNLEGLIAAKKDEIASKGEANKIVVGDEVQRLREELAAEQAELSRFEEEWARAKASQAAK